MIKSIYIDSQNTRGLEGSGANYLMVNDRNITPDSWKKLQSLNCTLSIALDAFGKQDCPANPAVKQKLFDKIHNVLQYFPAEIWLDRFRFGGDCTDIDDSDAEKAHRECEFCKNLNRVDYINGLAKHIKEEVGEKSQVGYFAVAFKSDHYTKLRDALGLDYQTLGKIFDMSSPMLYHRMIKRPVEYISEYVKWMAEVTQKPVLPIIQVKDMPDDLPDEMTEAEIQKAFDEAKKEPSVGVAIFWWQHVLEKNKQAIVSRLFSK